LARRCRTRHSHARYLRDRDATSSVNSVQARRGGPWCDRRVVSSDPTVAISDICCRRRRRPSSPRVVRPPSSSAPLRADSACVLPLLAEIAELCLAAASLPRAVEGDNVSSGTTAVDTAGQAASMATLSEISFHTSPASARGLRITHAPPKACVRETVLRYRHTGTRDRGVVGGARQRREADSRMNRHALLGPSRA